MPACNEVGSIGMTETVSIALASYCGEKFIAKQLDSLEAQIFKPHELIITDDGSPDGTRDIARDFASRASFPVSIKRNEKRLGFAGNFMKAASLCTGSLIAFCDQDDVWYPDKLSTMVRHFEDRSVVMAEHAYDLIDAEDRLIQPAPKTSPRSIPALGWPTTWADGPGFAMIFRPSLMTFDDTWDRSVFKADRNKVAGHDQWIAWLAKSLGTTVFEPTPLAGYRQHGQNTFGAFGAPIERKKTLADHAYALDRFADCMAASRVLPRWGRQAPLAVDRNKKFASELALQAQGGWGSLVWLLTTNAYFRRRWPLGRRAFLRDIADNLGITTI